MNAQVSHVRHAARRTGLRVLRVSDAFALEPQYQLVDPSTNNVVLATGDIGSVGDEVARRSHASSSR